MTLDDLLASTRDVPSVDAPPLARGRDAMLAAVHDDLASRARMVRRRTRRRLVGTVAAIAGAAVGVIVILPADSPTSEQEATPVPPAVEVQFSNASQLVDAAAVGAGREPAALGDAPYWKVVSRYAQTGGDRPEENSSGERTIWQGITGPGVLRDTFGEDIALEDARPLSLPRATLRLGGHAYTWREINAGALDRDQIHDLLTAGEEDVPSEKGRPPHEWYFFKQAGELLSETPASPAVRQAIWEELATLTGVTTTGKVTDAVGRSGWDLSFAFPGHGSQRFVVDPASGAILQAEQMIGGSTYRMTYLESGPADVAPSRSSETEMPVEPAG